MEEYPHWTAAVFQAISGSSEEVGAASALTEATQAFLADEESQIAAAFSAAVQTLPRQYAQWHKWFGHLIISEEYQDHLRQSRVVRSIGEYAMGLVRYGLSPVSFFEAARGVQLLADRLLMRHSGLRRPRRWTGPTQASRRGVRNAVVPPRGRLTSCVYLKASRDVTLLVVPRVWGSR